MESNLPISERFRVAAAEHVAKDAIASLLEESKSAILSQRMAALGDVPVSRAEMTVKASPEWADYIARMVNAREAANVLRVEVEFLRMKASEEQSAQANRRAEMRL